MNYKNRIHKWLGDFFVRKNTKQMTNDLKIIIDNNPSFSKSLSGENEWLQKWSKLMPEVSPLFYRIYGRCIGEDINIVPDDVARSYIEPALNMQSMVPFYNDKNSLGLFIDSKYTPKVFFRAIGGGYFNGNYNNVSIDNLYSLIQDQNVVVVKPSKDMGGRGVSLFKRVGNRFVNSDGVNLEASFLKANYKTDYLIQEYFIQSEFTKQFNPSSVNTIRMAVYRDVNDNRIHVLGAVLRIGNSGSEVDNASQGGVFVSIDKTGVLGKEVWDHNCIRKSIHNDINFEIGEYKVPNYNNVVDFAKMVTSKLPHMRLLALDVVLDKKNNPKLIEVNSQSFTIYFYQFPSKTLFGKYSDDVFNYCLERKRSYKVTAYRYLST